MQHPQAPAERTPGRPRPVGAPQCGGQVRRAGTLRQPGWGCRAGRSARPRLRLPDPRGPAQGSQRTAIRPLQRALEVRAPGEALALPAGPPPSPH